MEKATKEAEDASQGPNTAEENAEIAEKQRYAEIQSQLDAKIALDGPTNGEDGQDRPQGPKAPGSQHPTLEDPRKIESIGRLQVTRMFY